MLKTSLGIVLFFSVLGMGAYSWYRATHSERFIVRVVEITNPEQGNEKRLSIDSRVVQERAGVPVGKTTLFSLKLHAIEKRVLEHSWIRGVRLEKKFPQTLAITITPREPRALLQTKDDGLLYVDADGTAFGPLGENIFRSLPILSGIEKHDVAKLREALGFLESWEKTKNLPKTEVSSLQWDGTLGYRFLVVYPLLGAHRLSRSLVEFGSLGSEEKLGRLVQVIRYLRAKSVSTRRILVGEGKKIVVKTAPNS